MGGGTLCGDLLYANFLLECLVVPADSITIMTLIRGHRRLLRQPLRLFAFVIISSGLESSAFSFSSSRLTRLRAHDNEGDAEQDAPSVPDSSDRRRATARKRDPYKFGDITRSVVRSTTSGVEEVVRSVSGNQEYQFGDITKKVVGSTTDGIEGKGFLKRATVPEGCPGELTLTVSPFVRRRAVCHGKRG